ncbi:hypothetical protein [Synechococcus elongatus]|uniref:hypothetical protein n=1 Tax=Synechococcus elongatus TaxID=32046 RepID=UPI0030CC01C8
MPTLDMVEVFRESVRWPARPSLAALARCRPCTPADWMGLVDRVELPSGLVLIS